MQRSQFSAFLFIAFLWTCLPYGPLLWSQEASSVLATNGHQWRLITTEHYNIVCPADILASGQYVANLLELLAPYQQESLHPEKNYRYTIILDEEMFTANGFVTILPRFSMFFGLPSTELGFEWYPLLAVHEGRHMFQLDTGRQGTTKVLTWLLGEQGLAPFFIEPSWLFEGDAVVTETLLTPSGRGRNPFFSLPFKAIALSQHPPSYQAMLLGSYKTKTPGAYPLGYMLYTRVRSEYDPQAPDTIFSALAHVPLPVLGPHIGVRRATGLTPAELYRETVETYGDFWRRQSEVLPNDPLIRLTPRAQNGFQVYRNLRLSSDGMFVAWFYSFNRGNEIHILSKEGKLLERVAAEPLGNIDTGGPYIIWDENIEDAKFMKSSNRIMLYDRRTGKRRELVENGRYTAPSLNSDGTLAGLLRWNEDQSGELMIVETRTGTTVEQFDLPQGEFWSSFDWSDDGKRMCYLSTGILGQTIGTLDRATGEIRTLAASTEFTFRSPRFIDGGILFTSSYSGVPAVYRLRDGEEEPELVFHRNLATFDADVFSGEQQIYFIDYYGIRGSCIGSAELPSSGGIPESQVPVMREDFFRPLLEQEPGAGILQAGNIPQKKYPDEAYNFSTKGLKLHSWSLQPRSADMLNNPTIGLSLRADTIAHTMSHQADMVYNLNEETFGAEYTFTFRQFRPDIFLQADSKGRDNGEDRWTEIGGTAGIALPFGASWGTQSWALTPEVSLRGERNLDAEASDAQMELSYQVEASRLGPSTFHSLQPRWGVSGSIGYTDDPFTGTPGDHFVLEASMMLPGLRANHGMRLGAAFEKCSNDDSGLVSFPRGWDYRETEKLAAMKSEYIVPLAYPDTSLGALAFFRRLRGGVYYDMLQDMEEEAFYSSAGAELNLDFNLLQLPIELSVGIREYYRFESGESGMQILLLGSSP
jgi:hypothetical protein